MPIRKDKQCQNSIQRVAEINNKLKIFASHFDCDFLNLDKIDESCLGSGKPHPNKKGNGVLANIFIEYCKNI